MRRPLNPITGPERLVAAVMLVTALAVGVMALCGHTGPVSHTAHDVKVGSRG